MPSIITHFILLDKTKQLLQQREKELFDKYPAYAYYGACGPDYLFFAPSDWKGLGPLMEFMEDAENLLRDLLEGLKEIGKVKETALNYVTGGAYKEIQKTIKYLMVTALAKVAEGSTDNVDLFKAFESPTQNYEPTSDWWWMDLLHSKRTGEYCRNLWKLAKGNEKLEAYVLGYMTHVGGDVIIQRWSQKIGQCVKLLF